MSKYQLDDLRRLRKLARRGARLSVAPDGAVVLCGHGGDHGGGATVAFDLTWISTARERGWIEAETPETWAISRRGRAWLKAGAVLTEAETASAGPRKRLAPAALDGRTTLGWLRSRKGPSGTPLISEAELMAGERLRDDYLSAQALPHITANLSTTAHIQGCDRRGQNALADRMDRLIRARQRVEQALGSVGPEMAGLLVDVCCRDHAMAAVEKARGWPQRAGKVVVGLALRQLARHYGYSNEPPERAKPELN